MRHHNGLRKLNRTSSHRLAMLRNMTNSLLRHEVIKTTLPKAKELRRVIEPMITLARNHRWRIGVWHSIACVIGIWSVSCSLNLVPVIKRVMAVT